MKVFKLAHNLSKLERPLAVIRACCGGFSSVADDFIERKLDLNEHCIDNPNATYFMLAIGESMEPEIKPNDILIVDRSSHPNDKDIVVCILDGEMAVKYLRCVEGRYFLESENQNYKRVYLTPQREFQVWGVVVRIIREYRSG